MKIIKVAFLEIATRLESTLSKVKEVSFFENLTVESSPHDCGLL